MEEQQVPIPLKLGVGLPHYGLRSNTFQADMWISLGFALAGASERFTLHWREIVDVCGIEVARNTLMNEALEAGCDWLFMVDSDTWHADAFDVLQAISDADKAGAAVMAVATPLRRRAEDDVEELMIYSRKADDALEAVERSKLTHLADMKHGLAQIDAAATSMMAINLGWLKTKQLAPPWFRFEWKYGSLDFTAEDKSFCRRVREAGGTIVTPTNFVAKHMGRGKVL